MHLMLSNFLVNNLPIRLISKLEDNTYTIPRQIARGFANLN